MKAERPVALITGGTSGIGSGIALSLAEKFDLALGFEKNEKNAKARVKQIKESFPGARVEAYRQELSGMPACRELLRQIQKDFPAPPTVLVHSAGRIADDLFINAKFDSQMELLQQHLVAGMALAHLCLPSMYKARRGRMIFMSSMSAHHRRPGQAVYAGAKSGIEGFAATLALEVAHRGITVNCIAPGLIESEMTSHIVKRLKENPQALKEKIPAGFIGEPRDIGELARFLCSEDARYITGAVLPVDGGQSLGDSRP
ncbi:MAG: SDR family oxidoreductase [Bdellovibrionota bacterium]